MTQYLIININFALNVTLSPLEWDEHASNLYSQVPQYVLGQFLNFEPCEPKDFMHVRHACA